MDIKQTVKTACNIGVIVELAVEKADILTLHRDGSLSAYFDDKENDERIVLNYYGNRKKYFHVAVLGGFNPEKNMWTKTTGEGSIDLQDMRGQKALTETYKKLSKTHYGFLPDYITLYRKGENLCK